jgi:competence protein ComEC
MQAVPVDWTLTSLPDLDPLVLMGGPAGRCEAGQRWEWDGVQFEVLHPTLASYSDRSVKDNDRSCVLKVEAPGGRALLPADIERRSEEELLRRGPERLAADVLLAPHQGSRTSSIADFVRAVAPRVVVFPVGYRNRFGHPHRDVLRRYQDQGGRIYRTDRDGAVKVDIRAEGSIRVTPYRSLYRRYWQTPMVGDPVPGPQEFASLVTEVAGSGSRLPGGR